MKYRIITFSIAFLTLTSSVNAEKLRNPCLEPYKSLLVGHSLAPKYKFVDFSKASTKNILNYDEFYVISDDAIKSNTFDEFLNSKNPSRIMIKTSTDSSKFTSVLNSKISNPKIFFAMPEDKTGVINLYSESLTASGVTDISQKEFFYSNAEKTFTNARKKLNAKHVDTATLLDKSKPEISYKAQLLEYISSSKDISPIIIFAHNQNNKLMFPDGTSITITDFATKVSEKNRTPIILSCNTYSSVNSNFEGIITTKDLYFDKFVDAIVEAQTKMYNNSSSHCLYLGDYLKLIDNVFIDDNTKKYRIILISVPVGAASIGVGVAIVEGGNK